MAYNQKIARAIAAALCGLDMSLAAAATPTAGVQLPVPCAAGSCGANAPANWVSSGRATAVQAGNSLTVNQATSNVVLNWKSFNISSNGTVTFKQPTDTSVALNQIFQGDPSKILGHLSANGDIYLINQNGIIFGSGAQVNVGSLLASSLNLTPEAVSGILQAVQAGKPALQQATDANGNPLPAGSVTVQSGASVNANGGLVLLAAPQVINGGNLHADNGQVILAAGDSVYLAASTDPNLRGLLIQVGQGGTATNQAGGVISAAQGNVSMVGLYVNQMGHVSATTSVRENGSVYLLAQDGATISSTNDGYSLGASRGGTLQVGPGSQTDVDLALTDTSTAVDATVQPHSVVTLAGQTVTLAAGSSITAPSGNVSISAQASPGVPAAALPPTAGPGRLVIDSGATIDVAGAAIEQSMSSNVIPVQLRGTELANSPLQRSGPLYGQTVYVDIRQSGTLNGTAWVGSPLGDLSGYVAAVPHGVGYRNLAGGTISLTSDGAVFVNSGAVLNVSGGSVQYAPGYINTTQVLGTNGIVYDISQANPGQTYAGIVTSYTTSDPKWGTSQTYTASPGTWNPGYTQGYDAGSVSIAAPAVALNGSITATTVTGPYQTQLPGAIPSGALYRPLNQAPLGGQLILGVATPANSSDPNYLIDNVTFGNGGAAIPANPSSATLPASFDTVTLRPGLFGTNEVTELSVYANGTVTLPTGVSLDLPAGGSVALRAGSIELLGSIQSAGGSVSALAAPTLSIPAGTAGEALTLGSGATIEVAGEFVNQLPPGATTVATGVQPVNGGHVSLEAAGGAALLLEPKSVIDVSGGALDSAAGTLTDGTGGSITLGVGQGQFAGSVPIVLDSTLRGYAIQDGGSLSITANGICIAVANCAGGDSGTLWVAPQLFSADGFSSIALASDVGGLTVAPGTVIAPHEQTYLLTGNPGAFNTGTPLSAFASLGLLPQLQRTPVSVSLATNAAQPGDLPYSAAQFATAGILSIGHGAAITLDTGGSLSLTSNTSVVVDGLLSAPAGSISVATTTTLPIEEFLPTQGIWLLDGAQLLAPGVAQVAPNYLGLPSGSVLNGGTISISANRGFLFTDPGSLISASGTAATLDIIPTGSTVPGHITPTVVASSGGTISLAAAEGFALNGSVQATAGAGAGAAGGTLNVTLDGNLHGAEPFGGSAIFPLDPRQIVFSDSGPVVVKPGYAVPASWDGVGRLSAGLVENGGFSSVQLTATDLYDAGGPNPSGIQSLGSIVFAGNTSLTVPASLRFDAAQIEVQGGASVSLSSAYVGLGYTDTLPGTQTPPPLTAGTGSLSVNAGLVDLIGQLAVQGVSNTHITSTGDMRAIGVQIAAGAAQPIAGNLETQGTLTLTAAELYPTTLSTYTIDVQGPGGVLSILPKAGGSSIPLSAGGSLTLNADTVTQGGVVRAPFGQIVLDGNNVTLTPGSITSVSAGGKTIPFGSTQAGADWVFPLPDGAVEVFTASGPPAKSIVINSNQINVAKGATVDLTGGGDMQAFEFVPGVGGTVDVLASSTNPQQFAILPVGGPAYAPYDPQLSAGFGYPVGSTIVLGAGSGVPPGTYAVLPARYALLPGAYLVQPVSGYTDIAPGTAIAEPNGGTIVAGQLGIRGTSILQPQTSGFEVLPPATVGQLATYTLTSADSFFTSTAAAAGTVAPALPKDSGILQLLAGSQLQFNGNLAVAPASGGRGAEVDISATDIEIAGSAAPAEGSGAVVLTAAELNGLGAQSILVGGTRATSGGTVTIDTTATSVTVDPNVSLNGPELLFTATSDLNVGAGASLIASGSGTVAPVTQYALSGDGAFLRVSSGTQAMVSRTGADSLAGNLTIAPGAVIGAKGSATLEASGNLVSGATYRLSGAALAFTASQITLGTPAASGPQAGLVLDPQALSPLGLSDLSLTSQSIIGVAGHSTLDVSGAVELNTAAIDALTADAALTVQGKTLTLNGGAAAQAPAAVASSGALVLQGGTLNLGAGSTQVSGFALTELNGTTAILATGNGSLGADHALQLTTPLVTTASGVSYALTSADTLAVLAPAQAGKAAAPLPGFGGGLTFSGSAVNIDTAIALPNGGLLTVAATGTGAGSGVTLGSAAALNLAGQATVFDGLTVNGGGGRVSIDAAAGGLTMASGSSIDVSGAGSTGVAGEIFMAAPNGTADLAGTLKGLAGSSGSGGQFYLTAAQLPDLGAVNAALNSGGFTAVRSFVQTGAGNLLVSSGTTIRAHAVSLVNDGGGLTLEGSIDASGKSSGTVLLAATSGIDIEGSIAVQGAAGTPGGLVQLDVTGGGITLGTPGSISLGGAGGGLDLRMPQASLVSAAGVPAPQIALNGSISGGSMLQIEGVASYTPAGGVITADDAAASLSNPWYADATTFMGNAAGIVAALGNAHGLTVSVVPGIEVDSPGDLTLQSDWNLNAWRFNGAPGVLTLRAGGNLILDASLSDGFVATTGAGAFTLPTTPDQSWSYRLVAGALQNAADPLAVVDTSQIAPGSGSVMISAGVADSGKNSPPVPIMVRTGTGTIDITAAADLVFGNQASVIYTAGVDSGAGILLPTLANLAYPTGGGNINVRVGGDVVGAPTNQLVNSWLWRTGQPATVGNASATGWTVNYQWFEENIGALGGGNVSVTAGGNISELSVAIPSIGVQVGGTTAALNNVQVSGGGNLAVESGGSIYGGSYYVGRGTGALNAWSGVGADTTSADMGATGIAPILALGDASLGVTARSGVTIEDAINPMLLPQARVQPTTTLTASYFSTYSADSAVSLTASAGDVVLLNDPGRAGGIESQLSSMSFSSTASAYGLLIYPATLNAVALAGDVDVEGQPMGLWPAPRGNLNLLASDSVVFAPTQQLFMVDEDPALLPNPATPSLHPDTLQTLFEAPLAGTAYTPIHSAAFSGQEDPTPARIVAQTGDITDLSIGFLAKSSQIVAGGDINGLYVRGENVGSTDQTVITAGGNLVYTFPRDPDLGILLPDANQGIVLEGPGSLSIAAGGNINLGTSLGVTTAGNLYNPLQAASGADVTMLAGLTPSKADLTDFINRYLVAETTYSAQLLAYVNARLPAPLSSASAALQVFKGYAPAEQFAFLEQILLNEVRLGGESAAASGPDHDNYTRSFTALTTLFPGATDTNPTTGAQGLYPGSIVLYFSRVYTLDGGSITLLAPGGGVNVGIASPPLAFGLTKQPSDLGIVAQGAGNVSSISYGDFLVNQSRVFAADGGNILVWSTEGNIDAGRGAKTAISAPAPTIEFTPDGQVVTVFPAALQGSGIQALSVSEDTSPGNVDLFAPHGVVNASDAGIVAGNLTIGATAVLGRDNITVSGVSVGVPVETTGIGASVASSSSVASGATSVAASALESGQSQSLTPGAENAMAWLDVFLVGLGEENCKPEDVECLKRQKKE
jgi:filamentous hemagglutinin family protein